MERVRIALVGCGLYGEKHLQALRGVPGAEVVAVYDVDPARAQALADTANITSVCASLEELVNHPAVDAVDVVTPEESHLAAVMAALRSGKHVFVEKPLATDLGDCEQMIREAEARGLILTVGHIVRFEIKAMLLKEEIQSGRLGKVVSMHARRNRMKHLLVRYGRTHPALESSIHDIDLMLWFMGEPVRQVRGYERNATGGKHADVFWGILEFASGAIGVVETIWLLPKAAGVVLDDAFQVFGDQGVANVSFFPSGLTFWRDTGFEIPDVSYDPLVSGSAHGALREELSYFCECVVRGRTPEWTTAREARNAVRVALALMQSAREGREVVIDGWDR